MYNENYNNKYLILPADDGTRADTKLAQEFSDEDIAAMLASGYVILDKPTFSKLIGNTGKAYSIAKDGELYETPPYVPTADDKLAALDAEYEAKFDEINNAIIIAAAEGDDALQSELAAEKAALKEEYIQKRGEINAEE